MEHRTTTLGVVAAGIVATQALMPATTYANSNVNSHTTPAVEAQPPGIQYVKTTISVDGRSVSHPHHIISKDPWSGRTTSWVPVYYLQEALKPEGLQSVWNGSALNILLSSVPSGAENNTNIKPLSGQMQFLISGDQNEPLRAPKLVAKDPDSGVETTYVPVYYADLFLQQRLSIQGTWNGSTWSLSHRQQVSGTSSGTAIVPPQIDGTIASIQAGNPSYVTVTNANGPGVTSGASTKIKLPSGHFVSEDHWQSDGDTLDLFLGEYFIELTQTGQISDVMPDQGFAGIVKSINNNNMVIQKVLYDTQSTDSRAMKATNQTVNINLAPYTKVTSNGMYSAPISSVHVGDAILFILIGPPSEYIATQITDFRSPSDAGWDMQ